MRLDRDQAVLVVIDVQEKLMPVIDGAADVVRNIERLVRGCHILGIPVILTEQYVKGLGPTVESLRRVFEETSGYRPIEKSCFSAYGCEPFATTLASLGRNQVLIAGVETHVCVYQTVEDLLARDLFVSVIEDAVSSRVAQNRETALRRMLSDGAKPSSTEMALFELTVNAGTDEFRAISRLVK
ncbi:MAG TPA: hydrolase [Thermoanaerobaculia bacterium]|jgi:nicotinamidase-related amidase|nr:hydrolase [Thermoanaerobaculia bacterium]